MRTSIWMTLAILALVFGAVGCADDANPSNGGLGDGIDGPGGNGNGSKLCGDGTCQDDESFFTCRDDCAAPEFVLCLAEKCAPSWDRCLDTEGCTEAVGCLDVCGTDTACADECFYSASDVVQPILTQLTGCGRENACFDDTPPPSEACPGECEEYVAGADCQCEANCAVFGDCCDGYEEICKGTPPPEDRCGNGVCDADETAESCAEDCEERLDPFQECVANNCPEQLAACEADSDCAAVLACVDNCSPNDQDCQGACLQSAGFNMPLVQLGFCVQQAGCLDGGPGPGPEPDDCGDGECGPGENADNCPQDCAGAADPTNPLLVCAKEECGQQYQACLEDNGCANILNCIEDCPINQLESCAQGCLQGGGFSGPGIQLGICIQSNGCLDGGNNPPDTCGDGDCQPWEDPGNCPQDCDEEPPPETCGDGNCQPWENPGNCPQDCDEEPPPESCGDGDCQPWEDPGNCPADCADEPGPECIEEECGGQLNACYGNNTCAQALQCFSNCPDGDDACYEKCWAEAGNNVELENLAKCNDEECSGPGGYCGDGICSAQESVDNCPDDCDEGGGSQCGDGNCDDSEDAESCPIDCADPEELKDEFIECLKKDCSNEWESCEDKDGCKDALECILDCDLDDEACTDECTEDLGFFAGWQLGELGECADQSECQSLLTGNGGGNNGGGGNEQAITQCLDDNCEEQVKACYDNDGCLEAYKCLSECGGKGGQCIGQCMQSTPPSQVKGAMMQCGQQNGCVGGGGPGGGP